MVEVVAPPPALPKPNATHKFEIEADTEIVGYVQKTVVVKDDTLPDIARRFDVGYEEILLANPGGGPLAARGGARGGRAHAVHPAGRTARRGWWWTSPPCGSSTTRRTRRTSRRSSTRIPSGSVAWGGERRRAPPRSSAGPRIPVWTVPKSVRDEHAEDGEKLPARVPAGPDNPLGQYMFRLSWPSYLIHGTNKPYGVGMRSSHGCMRLYPEDIAVFFDLIPIGTKVTVVNQPYLFGWRDGTLYFQAYTVMEDDSRDWSKNRARLLSHLLNPKARKQISEQNDDIDWQRVGDLAHSPRALPGAGDRRPRGLWIRWYRRRFWSRMCCRRDRTGMARPDCWSTRRPSTTWWAVRRRRRRPAIRKRPPSKRRSSSIKALPCVIVSSSWRSRGFRGSRGCRRAAADLTPIQSGLDYHSFANTEQFRVTHLDLDLRVDPFFKTLRGTVALHVKRLDPNATELILDSRDLNISDVEVKAQDVLGATSKTETTWVGRPFHFERKDPILGQALVIELPPSKNKTLLVRIDYETSPTAPALQWLTAQQTAGKRDPFFYTQSEPIGARSWIPLQDSPQVRVTYSAKIHTSGGRGGGHERQARTEGQAGRRLYLRDAGSGAVLPHRAGGRRPGVQGNGTAHRASTAEKSLVKAAAREFADTEAMIEISEKLFGPYRWGRYDILVLPPSFPVGGMENPRLSFITPTVIAGDKSLVSVIAHEFAHSWSGNLVSNATWRDLWLNEGFTDYLESRIVNAVYGEKREMMERVLGLRALEDDFATPETRGPGAGHRSARAQSGRGVQRRALRERPLVPDLSGGEIRPRAFRCLPARLFRSLRVPEHRHGTVPGLPAVESARPLPGRRLPRGSHGVGDRSRTAGGRGAAGVDRVRSRGCCALGMVRRPASEADKGGQCPAGWRSNGCTS